jgi:hypothetical protein
MLQRKCLPDLSALGRRYRWPAEVMSTTLAKLWKRIVFPVDLFLRLLSMYLLVEPEVV